jgi:hypothetical protein
MVVTLKIVACSLKTVKWLPSEECTRESELSCGEYNGESSFPCDEYAGELTFWCIWNKHQNRLTKKTYVENTREWRLPSVLITGRSWLPGVFCTSTFFGRPKLRSTPRCIHRWEVSTPRWWIHRRVMTPYVGEFNGESRHPGGEYNG